MPEGRMEERKAAEAGDGLEVRRCGCAPLCPDHTGMSGRGRGEALGKGRSTGEGDGAAQASAPAQLNPSEVQGGREPRREDSQTDSSWL